MNLHTQVDMQDGQRIVHMGLHEQVNAHPNSSTKLWDQTLKSQVK